MVIIAAVARTDQSSAVVDRAAELSSAFDEPLHLVHVLSRAKFVDLERTNVDETGTAIELDRIRELAQEIAEGDAKSISTEWESIGLIGDPAQEVVKHAADHNARYIVVGGRNRSPTGKALFGSVAQSIVLNAECPTVITAAHP